MNASARVAGRVSAAAVCLGALALAVMLEWRVAAEQGTFPVVVNVADYAGRWAVAGVQDWVTGSRTIDLAPGTHSFQVGGYAGWQVDVAPDGTLATNKSTSIAISAATVTFLTAPVTVDPVAYAGQWAMSYAVDWGAGQRTVRLVRDQTYDVAVGDYAAFFFSLTADGTTTITQNGAAAVASGSTVTFNNTPITVNPAPTPDSGPTATPAAGSPAPRHAYSCRRVATW